MKFQIELLIEALERTSSVIASFLVGLSDEGTKQNEGLGSWSTYGVMGHLIHGGKTNWTPRMKVIRSNNKILSFDSFDRYFYSTRAKKIEQGIYRRIWITSAKKSWFF